jgi:hypothetical protein
MEHQLYATITVLLISKISSTCFGQSFAHLQERKNEIFTLKQLPSYHTVPSNNAQKTCPPHQQDIIPYVVKICLALLKMGKSLPETCLADLGDQ